MERKTVLVTGGAGFIGKHLVRKLVDRGHHVRVLDVAERQNLPETVEFHNGSILNSQLVRELMTGVDYVYHLAANPNLWSFQRKEFFKVNYEGTKVIIKEAIRCNINKLVFTSSETILRGYRQKTNEPITEDTTLPELDDLPGPYSHSKLLADLAVRKAVAQGLPAVIVYPTTPIGPGDVNLTPPTRMILDFMNGENPAFLDCYLNFIRVEDVAEGHILAAEKGFTGNRYILGNENLKLSMVLKMLQEVTGKKMPDSKIPYSMAIMTAQVSEFISDNVTRKSPKASIEGVRLAGANLIFDCNKAVTELGLPQSPIKKALLDTTKWLKENGYIKKKRRFWVSAAGQ